jgi:3-dehydroquinate synthase
MDLIERTIQVTWHHRVLFTDGVFSSSNTGLRDVLSVQNDGAPPRVLVILESALATLQPGLVHAIEDYFKLHPAAGAVLCAPMIFPGGEQAKSSLTLVTEIHAAIDRQRVDRHSYVITVGGGAVLDLVGLAAATAHRGVRHIRIPTTTLSQCDSGVGVKNGINAFGKKNFIGTFAPPFAVINDFQLLSTLPPRDKRAGLVEAVKVACIRSLEFFESMERDAAPLARFDENAMRRVIRTCAELHMNHIAGSGDPFEFGSARPLDFGHWAAHKLEQLSRFTLRHGEAVAVGIALDVTYSRLAGFLEAENAERVLNLLETLGFELFASDLLALNSAGTPALLEGLEDFREHLGGRLAITQLRDIGVGFEVNEMNPVWVHEAIVELKSRAEKRPRHT